MAQSTLIDRHASDMHPIRWDGLASIADRSSETSTNNRRRRVPHDATLVTCCCCCGRGRVLWGLINQQQGRRTPRFETQYGSSRASIECVVGRAAVPPDLTEWLGGYPHGFGPLLTHVNASSHAPQPHNRTTPIPPPQSQQARARTEPTCAGCYCRWPWRPPAPALAPFSSRLPLPPRIGASPRRPRPPSA